MSTDANRETAPTSPFTRHARVFEQNRFVYPVVSRRSRGVSLGVNLNPDKVCNFDCIYCQVDRVSQSQTRFVETDALLDELRNMLEVITSGEIYQYDRFCRTPPALRRFNDIAFSGDGEPTTYRNFDEIVAACADLKRELAPDDVKLVLITNASMFHRPAAWRGLEVLQQNNGEIWAKLDAGTEAYYQLVERTTIPFARILDNIQLAARRWPLVIQAMFMRIRGESPSVDEQHAFCDRLNEIRSAGGRVQLVQLYTIARRPAVDWVAPLTNAEVDAFVQLVQQRTGLPTQPFYGVSPI